MIIEFELQGSNRLFKGLFDTYGLWVKFEEEGEYVPDDNGNPIFKLDGYKIYSHFSFAYYHTDKSVCDLVYSGLIRVLRGASSVDIEGIGYLRKVSK